MAEELKFQIVIGGEAATQKAVEDLTESVQGNIEKLQAQKALLTDSGFQAAQAEAAKLKNEIEEMTKPAHATGFQALGSGIKNAANEIPALSSGIGGFSSALGILANPLALLPVALAGGAVEMAHMASENAELVVHLQHLSASTGLTVNELYGLRLTVKPLGMDVDQVAGSISRMEMNLGKNGKAIRELGITSKDPIEALAQLADKFAATEDPMERAKLASAALGRSWKDLAPLLEEGGASLRSIEGENKLSDADVARYEGIHNTQIEMAKEWEEIKFDIGDLASGPLLATEKGFKSILDTIREIHKSAKDDLANDVHSLEDHENSFLTRLAMLVSPKLRGAMIADMTKNPTEGLGPKAAGKGAGAEGLSEEDQKAIDDAEAFKQKMLDEQVIASASADQREIVAARIKYKNLADQYSDYADVVKAIRSRESQEIAQIIAKQGAALGAHADSEFEKATGGTYAAFQLANPNGIEADGPGRGNSVTKGMKAKDAEDQKKFIMEATDAKAESAKITMNWDKAIADAQKKEHDEHVKQITEEANLVQGFAARELATAMQGKLTEKKLQQDLQNEAIQQIAERSTKWLETQILQMAFSETAATTSTANSVADAAVVSTAWAPASMAASIGTFGAAAGTGEASWFQAMASGTAFGAHAAGGFAFGPSIFGERGPEAGTPIVPMQITTASHTTNNTGETHFHFHGYSVEQIASILPRAQATQLRSRGQTSRSGR